MNRTYAYVSVYYSLVFMAYGAFWTYMGLYYSELHLSHIDIGMLTSMGSVVAIFAQPAWGLVADRSRSKNRILLVCLLFTGLSVWLMPWAGHHLWLLLLATIVYYIFQCAVNPLSDTIALELGSTSDFNFSRVRTAGSVGFALMSPLAGWILDIDIYYMFPMFSVIMLAAFLFAFRIPNVEGHQRKIKVRFKELFTDKPLVRIYLFTFVVEATMGFFFTFNAVIAKEQGISTAMIGVGVMIGSISQFPFMLLFDRLYSRFGVHKILFFSGIVHVFRWVVFAFPLTNFTMLATWALHGGTFILFYFCLAQYVNDHVQKELHTSGQMMNSLLTGAISRIVGGLAGGIYASYFGIGSGFALCAAVCAVASGVYAFYFRREVFSRTDSKAVFAKYR